MSPGIHSAPYAESYHDVGHEGGRGAPVRLKWGESSRGRRESRVQAPALSLTPSM